MLLAFELLLALIGAAATTFYVLPLIPPVRRHMEKVGACGYTDLPPRLFASWIAYKICQFLQFVQTGPVKVIGQENLNTDKPVIFAPNHVSWVDVPIVMVMLKRRLRLLATRQLFRKLRGVMSLFLTRIGVIAVDQRRGKGRPAADAAVRILTAGEQLVLFPEGYTYMTGTMGPFRKGVTHIAKEASEKAGRPVCIVPIFIRYGKTPDENWIASKWNMPSQYLWQFLTFWKWRHGAVVVVGKPICSADFPADITTATDMLAASIAALDPDKRAVPLPSGVNLPLPADDEELPLPRW